MEKKCKDLVQERLESRIDDLKRIWKGYQDGNEETSEEFYNYGLSFDYVAPKTFDDQTHGYFRYQISYGGPSSEFRFYVDLDYTPHTIEFWYMDWFDGAKVDLSGKDFDLMEEIFNNFHEIGSTVSEYEKSLY